MAVSSPNAFELGLLVHRGNEQVRIEGIWELRAAKDHLFQGLEDIL